MLYNKGVNRKYEREEIAWAKINVGLNVVGQSDGYHLIDTVMLPVDLGERVRLNRAEGICVRYSDGRTYQSDTCLKAAERYCRTHRLAGVEIEVEKHIPEGWGLGGSSADAAAVVRGLQALYGQDAPSGEELKDYGSDVAMQFAATPCRCRGRGEKISEIRAPRLYVAIVCGAGLRVDSAAAYRLYDKIGGERGEVTDEVPLQGAIPNALERAALALEPRIGAAKAALVEAGFPLVTMTGSGAAYIGCCTRPTTYRNAMARLKLPDGYRCLEAHSEEHECRKIH